MLISVGRLKWNHRRRTVLQFCSTGGGAVRSSECRLYADQCVQMAGEAPEHRARLLDLAKKWCDAAADLKIQEEPPGDETLYGGRRPRL